MIKRPKRWRVWMCRRSSRKMMAWSSSYQNTSVVLVTFSIWSQLLTHCSQHRTKHTRKCTAQLSPSVMHCGTNVGAPHWQPKPLKKLPSVAASKRHQMELALPRRGETAESTQRERRGGHQDHLSRFEGSNVRVLQTQMYSSLSIIISVL